ISISNIKDLINYQVNEDKFALHKGVICFLLFPSLCSLKGNIKNEDIIQIWKNTFSEEGMRSYFQKYFDGYGIKLETQVKEIPTGSGLGISSILILSCVRALNVLFSNHEGNFTHHN